MSTNSEAVVGVKSRGNRRITMTKVILAIAVVTAITETVSGVGQDSKGNLILNATDMTNLAASVATGDRGDRNFAGFFKNQVPPAPITYRSKAYHHIIPYKQIKGLSSSWTQQQVQDYINLPHIQGVLINNGILRKSLYNQARAIHASIAWNPHDLVIGPEPKDRCSDPGPAIDTDILNKQSKAYINAANPFVNVSPQNPPNLNDFGRLPVTTPVTFLLNATLNCYYL